MAYSDSDFERFYLRYMAMPRGESIRAFWSLNNVTYNLFDNHGVLDEYLFNITLQ